MKPMHYSERGNDEPVAPKVDWQRVAVFTALLVAVIAVWGCLFFAARGG